MTNSMLPYGWRDVDEELTKLGDVGRRSDMEARIAHELLRSLSRTEYMAFRQAWWNVAFAEASKLVSQEGASVYDAAYRGIWKADEWAEAWPVFSDVDFCADESLYSDLVAANESRMNALGLSTIDYLVWRIEDDWKYDTRDWPEGVPTFQSLYEQTVGSEGWDPNRMLNGVAVGDGGAFRPFATGDRFDADRLRSFYEATMLLQIKHEEGMEAIPSSLAKEIHGHCMAAGPAGSLSDVLAYLGEGGLRVKDRILADEGHTGFLDAERLSETKSMLAGALVGRPHGGTDVPFRKTQPMRPEGAEAEARAKASVHVGNRTTRKDKTR